MPAFPLAAASAALLVLAMLLPPCAATTNFVVFLVDDWGWGDLGANGFGAETPNMDSYAARGVRFVDMHSNSVCTPTRSALQTGRLNLRMGVNGNFGTAARGGLALEEITIAQLLQQGANYSTSATGKWHLGHSGGDGRPGGGYHPTWRGYDSYVGVPYSIDMGCSNTPLSENGTAIHGCPDSGAVNSTDSPAIPLYNSTAPHCSGETCSADVIQQPADLTTLDDHYVQHVSDFLALHAAGGPRAGRPFFAYVPFSHTHVPLSHNPRFQNKSRVNTLFGDTLLEMDDTFGRIMKALEQASLDTDTLVLVVGDNGPWNVKCEDAGSQGPFVGQWMLNQINGSRAGTGKFTAWEGGHREASFAYWPRGIASPGRVSHATLHVMDFLPTLAALAGVALPGDRHYDGVDFSAILTSGGDAPLPREFLFHQTGSELVAARHGRYKAFFKTAAAGGCLDPSPKVKDEEHDPPLLFDLEADPAESSPVVNATLAQLFVDARAAILADVNSSFKTHSNYSGGEWTWWACCNSENAACQCEL